MYECERSQDPKCTVRETKHPSDLKDHPFLPLQAALFSLESLSWQTKPIAINGVYVDLNVRLYVLFLNYLEPSQ